MQIRRNGEAGGRAFSSRPCYEINEVAIGQAVLPYSSQTAHGNRHCYVGIPPSTLYYARIHMGPLVTTNPGEYDTLQRLFRLTPISEIRLLTSDEYKSSNNEHLISSIDSRNEK